MEPFDGKWALVTGASSGIGEAFARVLAERGAALVLAARREKRLADLAGALAAEHGTQSRVVPVDLGTRSGVEQLYETTRREGIAVDLLVNNAGFGLYGPHMQIPWEREHAMLELDVVSLAKLTKLYVAEMLARGHGWVVQVASVGAYQPSPTYAAYSAAKAFVLSHGEALAYELRDTGVHVTVLSPGVTRSEFLEVSGQAPTFYHRMTMMPAKRVAEIGLDAVVRGKPSVVPGLLNKAAAFSLRFMPRRMQAAVAHLTMNAGAGA